MRPRLPMWVPGVAVAAALLALMAWSFWQRWQLLTASPFPLGVDGYFYPVELRSLLDRGALQYPASPLTFYLLAPLAAATDPITGAKLGAALYGAAIAVPMYGVGARLGGRGAGLIAAALATTSVGSAYLTIEFVKNGIGLTVAVTALWLALAAAERPTRGRVVAAVAGVVAAWAAHKMAAALVVVIAIPAGIAAATAHGRLRGRRLIYAVAGLVLVSAVALGIGAAAPRRFLSIEDARLVRGLVSSTPRWTAPALVFPSGELALGHDALLGLVVAIAAIAARWLCRRRAASPSKPDAGAVTAAASSGRGAGGGAVTGAASSGRGPGGGAATGAASSGHGPIAASAGAAAWPILVLALLIGLPFLAVTDRQGLGFRLRIAAFVPAALSAAILVRVLLGRSAHGEAAPAAGARGILARVALGLRAQGDGVLAAIALVLALVRQPGTRLDGEIVTHPALVSAAQALRGHVPPGATLIIPERHIAFMVAWYTGAAVAIRPDRVAPAQRYRLLPLHFIGADSPLDHQLIAARTEPSLVPPLGVHPRHPNGLVLVAEPTWDWILGRLPAADRARALAWPTL